MAVTLFAFISVLVACGSDQLTGPNGVKIPRSFVGSYDVATINDKALPFTIFADTSYTYERLSGSLVLSSDGRYIAKMTSRQTILGRVDTFIDSTGGTWTYSDTLVTFADDDQVTIDHATFASGKLTFAEPEGKVTNTYVYVRK